MTKLLSCLVGVLMIAFACACGGALPASPTAVAPGPTAAALADTVSATPAITLQSDNTASPASVSVHAGGTVLVTNASGHYLLLRSYNCTEFSSMGLAAGASRHTMPFNPAGKSCDYFAYYNSQKVDIGQVNVQ